MMAAAAAAIFVSACTADTLGSVAGFKPLPTLNGQHTLTLGESTMFPATGPERSYAGATQSYSGPTPTEGVPRPPSALLAGQTPSAAAVQPAAASGSSAPPDDVATRRIEAAGLAPRGRAPQAASAGSDRDSRQGFLASLFGRPDSGSRPVIRSAEGPLFARASLSGSDEGNRNNGTDGAGVQVASAAGLARLAPNGLRTQHDGVDVKCLKPALVDILDQVERHFGEPVVVTSGYRSPGRNRKASGASNSLHIYCAAADIQVEGVSKWDLASYMRDLPGRGGVGTYCHTDSVHIDIGPRRDWNWRCRR
ncbi:MULTISPECIES: D-Ala-D-Ala carboxypeptidase family metallohydrolase [unclassified Roseitalea]|uniref:YcbK family protein n=1 Tax=unclassified Roseitalea TaxID=2639107 RepID=UPI00273E3E86|nr:MULTISPECIES: D-Ala-D-Ala carboxypeptidase family metallohydrolase [unclassified Roseitalea]